MYFRKCQKYNLPPLLRLYIFFGFVEFRRVHTACSILLQIKTCILNILKFIVISQRSTHYNLTHLSPIAALSLPALGKTLLIFTTFHFQSIALWPRELSRLEGSSLSSLTNGRACAQHQ